MPCRQCGNPCECNQTWLSKGTGYCGFCATSRLHTAMNTPKCKEFLASWQFGMATYNMLMKEQNGRMPAVTRLQPLKA